MMWSERERKTNGNSWLITANFRYLPLHPLLYLSYTVNYWSVFFPLICCVAPVIGATQQMIGKITKIQPVSYNALCIHEASKTYSSQVLRTEMQEFRFQNVSHLASHTEHGTSCTLLCIGMPRRVRRPNANFRPERDCYFDHE